MNEWVIKWMLKWMNTRRFSQERIYSHSRHLHSVWRLWDWKKQPVSGFIHKNCLVELYTAPPLLNADGGRKGKRDNEGLQMKWVQLCNQSTFSEKESASLAKNLNWITEPEFWWERTLPLATHFYLSSSCFAYLFQKALDLFSVVGSSTGISLTTDKCMLFTECLLF